MTRLVLFVMTVVIAACLAAVAPAQSGPLPPRTVSSSVGPGSDDRQPWEYKVDGILVGQKRPTLCTGNVDVVFRLAGKVAVRRAVAVRAGIAGLRDETGAPAACGYRTQFKLRRKPGGPRKGAFVVTASFLGNAEMAATSAPSHRVRFGR